MEKAPFAALSYVPGLFLITAFKKGKDEFYLWHSKMGAGMTLLFFVPVLLNLFVSTLIGSIFYFVWGLAAALSAFKAFKHEKWALPGMGWAQKIPLSGLTGGQPEQVVSTPDAETEKTGEVPVTPQEATLDPMPATESVAAEPAPEPEPIATEPEPTPEPESAASEPEVMPEPEPVAAEPEPEPEPAPEPEPIAAEPEPTPAPEPVAPVAPVQNDEIKIEPASVEPDLNVPSMPSADPNPPTPPANPTV